MDYVDPDEWYPPASSRPPSDIAAGIADRFVGPCYRIAAGAAGPVRGVMWTGDWFGDEPVTDVQIEQELQSGTLALVITTLAPPDLSSDILTLMSNVYASNIGVDGPPRERLARARAARSLESTPCVLTVDGNRWAAEAISDHAAVVMGCTLPDRVIVVFLEGNPLPRPTMLTSMTRRAAS